jgi:hypothetical protein
MAGHGPAIHDFDFQRPFKSWMLGGAGRFAQPAQAWLRPSMADETRMPSQLERNSI